MKKPELLAPAGNMEALRAAIQNGADAVYLGGKQFGARAFSDNFSAEELKEALTYAHSYGARIYVTLNTVLSPDEFDDALNFAAFCSREGVDGILIQDLGLAEEIKNRFPDLPLHSSTQMHIHNKEGLEFLRSEGFTRAVLAREVSLDEIDGMSEVDIETEVFINGALCVSCSGQCYMSIDNGPRSGNKGTCAGPCRLRYELIEDESKVETDGDYLLSPKDLYSVEQIPDLIKHGIDSFKIEGRMKRPEFVAFIVSQYRRAIDAAFDGNTFVPDQKSAMKLFNRGFTKGHLYNARGHELMNPVRPNHMGIPLGTVISAKHNRFILSLDEDLHKGDGIRILQKEDAGLVIQRMEQNNRPIESAKAGTNVTIPYPYPVRAGSKAVLTTDANLLDEIRATYEKNTRFEKVSLTVHSITGEPLTLLAQYKDHKFEVCDDAPVEKAKKSGTSEDVFLDQLSRTKDTPYVFDPVTFELSEDAFVPVSRINKLRRTLIDQIFLKMTEVPKRRFCNYIPEKTYVREIPEVIIEVSDERQLDIVRRFGYFAVSESLPDAHVYPRYSYTEDLVSSDFAVIHEIAEMNVSAEKKYASQYFNVTNAHAAHYLLNHGVDAVELSRELTDEEIAKIVKDYRMMYTSEPSLGLFVYGRREVMLTKYCAPNMYLTKNAKPKCGLCKKHSYKLRSVTKDYPIRFDDHCFMHIMESVPYDRIRDLGYFRDAGIRFFRLRFTDESPEDVRDILTRLSGVLPKEAL
ncbi:MAG: U32 family peptidase [Erysipelotrichales bacterium]|nr:U32 family peptidase [Erysipelotrichales bacterium]